MSSVNKVILVGNLGKDPEIRNTQQGKKIANLSIATSEKWKDEKGEKKGFIHKFKFKRASITDIFDVSSIFFRMSWFIFALNVFYWFF